MTRRRRSQWRYRSLNVRDHFQGRKWVTPVKHIEPGVESIHIGWPDKLRRILKMIRKRPIHKGLVIQRYWWRRGRRQKRRRCGWRIIDVEASYDCP
jgi:hypothetical protein